MVITMAADIHAHTGQHANLLQVHVGFGNDGFFIYADILCEQIRKDLPAHRSRQSLLQHLLDKTNGRTVVTIGSGMALPVFLPRLQQRPLFPMPGKPAAHPGHHFIQVRLTGQDKVDAVDIQKPPLHHRTGHGKKRPLQTTGVKDGQHMQKMIKIAVVEGQQSGLLRQVALTGHGIHQGLGSDQIIVRLKMIQLTVKLVQGTPLDGRVTGIARLPDIVIHDDADL